mgnify:CR=1 FL=1
MWAGRINNTNVEYRFDSSVISFVDLNSNTYYIQTPKQGTVDSTMPYYNTRTITAESVPVGLLVKDLPYYFYSPGVGKFSFSGVDLYIIAPEAGVA